MMNRWSTIARYGGVGDSIVATSVLPGLKKRFDGVEMLCQDPWHVVFENNPYIDKLSVYKKDEIPREGWQEFHYIRAHESELFVNLSHSMETLVAFVPAQCQFQWPAKARRKIAGKNYLELVHDICDVPYDEIAPNFFPLESEMERARGIRGRLGSCVIGWVLTGTRLDKIYPFSPMVVGRLIRELGADVIMFGHPEKDREIAEVVNEHVNRQNGSSKGLHYARSMDPTKAAWPLRDVLATVQQCDLVIGPDTGPMWAVAMREMPKIVLLSHASPENITKYWKRTVSLHADQGRVPCWPCHQLHDTKMTCTPNKDDNGAACISDISAEAIVETARRCLAGKADYREMTGEEALLPLVEAPTPPVVRGPWPDIAEYEEDEGSISVTGHAD